MGEPRAWASTWSGFDGLDGCWTLDLVLGRVGLHLPGVPGYREESSMHRLKWVSLLLLAVLPARADNWPAWRGASARGISDERDVPSKWSATENVRWKTPLPGPGNSTPIVWGDRLFLTQAIDGGKRRALLALARKTGKKLWQQEVPCATAETTHGQNPPCSGSPVTDGTTVFAHFGSAGVLACDMAGKRIWHKDLGAVMHKWGNGSSPILYKDLLIVWQGPASRAF